MKRVVCTAEAFGFGPVSKLLSITENLKGVRKVFFGGGVAFDLASLHSFDEIHQLGPGKQNEILALLKKADLFLNVMDFQLSDLAKQAGVIHFLVDSLLWFRPTLPEGAREADIYFCQDFFNLVVPKIQEYGLSNTKIIGPITNEHFPRHSPRDQVIINFGGLENPFVEIGNNSNYPFVMLESLLPLVEREFSHILVTGRERVMRMCQKQWGHFTSIEFRMLNHMEMLEELYRSKALFTAPGIQTTFDAADKVPIFFLPPQNNSNVRNLGTFIDQGIATHFLTWEELYDFDLNQCKGSKQEEFNLILDTIKTFEEDIRGQKFFQQKICHFIQQKNTWPELLASQRKKLNSLGINGVKTVAQAIQNTIRRKELSTRSSQVIQKEVS